MITAKELQGKIPEKCCTVRDLARLINNRTDENPNYCCLLGAGASRTSGIRTGRELVEEWRCEVYQEFSGGKDLPSVEEQVKWLSENQMNWYKPDYEYSSLFEHKYRLLKQRRIFIEKQVAEKVPSIGYSYLVRLSEKSFLRTFFTTNFDDLLNEAFYQFSNIRPIVCAHDSSINNISVTSSRPKIIKIHGDYLFDGLKCTTTETNSLEKNMSEKFEQFLKEYGLIIVGYSGFDKSVLDILSDNIKSDQHIENGLYWCFRENDIINERVQRILEESRSFFVIIEGFDELMAELYDILCENCSPFNSQIASDRATHLIDSYIKNDELKRSKSSVIKKHLEELEKERHSSEFFSAFKALNSEFMKDQKLKNFEMIKFLHIERKISRGDYERALIEIQDELKQCEDQDFEKSLLFRLFICAKHLDKQRIAVDAANRMLQLESDNISVILDKVDALSNYKDRLFALKEALKINDHYPDLINRLAKERIQLISFGDPAEYDNHVIETKELLERSVSINPSIKNPAWQLLYKFWEKEIDDEKEKEAKLRSIIKEHIKQDPYSHLTIYFINEFCQKRDCREYNGIDLFEYIENAFKKHFPKNYLSHFSIFSDACIWFREYGVLKDLIDKCDAIKSLSEDEDYVALKVNLQLDVYRDLDNCISLAESYVKSKKSVEVEKCLLKLYIKANDAANATEQLKKIEKYLTKEKYFIYESEIFEIDGRFQDAIDSIERVPNKEFFAENYTTLLSYYYLMMRDYKKSQNCCKELLNKHNFSNKFQAEIINYEFSKSKNGGEVSKKRLNKIVQNPRDNTVKAVALFLLGDKDTAISILKSEMEKRFSNYYLFKKWPILNSINIIIEDYGAHLYDTKRCPSIHNKKEEEGVYEIEEQKAS